MSEIMNRGVALSLEQFSKIARGVPSEDIEKVYNFIKENGGIETYSNRIDLGIFVADNIGETPSLPWASVPLSNGKYFII